jgi:hypothetical protein
LFFVVETMSNFGVVKDGKSICFGKYVGKDLKVAIF